MCCEEGGGGGGGGGDGDDKGGGGGGGDDGGGESGRGGVTGGEPGGNGGEPSGDDSNSDIFEADSNSTSEFGSTAEVSLPNNGLSSFWCPETSSISSSPSTSSNMQCRRSLGVTV